MSRRRRVSGGKHWLYESDHDHERASETRREVVERLVDKDVLVVSGHYPGSGIGRLVTRAGRVVWEEQS